MIVMLDAWFAIQEDITNVNEKPVISLFNLATSKGL